MVRHQPERTRDHQRLRTALVEVCEGELVDHKNGRYGQASGNCSISGRQKTVENGEDDFAPYLRHQRKEHEKVLSAPVGAVEFVDGLRPASKITKLFQNKP